MAKVKHNKSINSGCNPLSIKDLVFQIKYLLDKNDYESAYGILKNYDLSIEDIISSNIQVDFTAFSSFLKSRL